jgi:hypothetical protein
MNACVIGNGPSRLQLDLQQIKSKLTTYGCNALYRDFMPDYLISMDYSMVDEILKKNIHKQTKFYTQHGNRIDERANRGEPINFVFGHKETLDSGNTALRIAMKNKHEIVYVIGFDYSKDPSTLPNVYSGTSNYAPSHVWPAASMRDTQWGQRIRKILREFPNQKIIRVNGTKSLGIDLPNYSEITIEQFKEILNA